MLDGAAGLVLDGAPVLDLVHCVSLRGIRFTRENSPLYQSHLKKSESGHTVAFSLKVKLLLSVSAKHYCSAAEC